MISIFLCPHKCHQLPEELYHPSYISLQRTNFKHLWPLWLLRDLRIRRWVLNYSLYRYRFERDLPSPHDLLFEFEFNKALKTGILWSVRANKMREHPRMRGFTKCLPLLAPRPLKYTLHLFSKELVLHLVQLYSCNWTKYSIALIL